MYSALMQNTKSYDCPVGQVISYDMLRIVMMHIRCSFGKSYHNVYKVHSSRMRKHSHNVYVSKFIALTIILPKIICHKQKICGR